MYIYTYIYIYVYVFPIGLLPITICLVLLDKTNPYKQKTSYVLSIGNVILDK